MLRPVTEHSGMAQATGRPCVATEATAAASSRRHGRARGPATKPIDRGCSSARSPHVPRGGAVKKVRHEEKHSEFTAHNPWRRRADRENADYCWRHWPRDAYCRRTPLSGDEVPCPPTSTRRNSIAAVRSNGELVAPSELSTTTALARALPAASNGAQATARRMDRIFRIDIKVRRNVAETGGDFSRRPRGAGLGCNQMFPP